MTRITLSTPLSADLPGSTKIFPNNLNETQQHRLLAADVVVMGILNVTPDSFSDGGQYNQLDKAQAQAERMLASGADIIDVGGESTRPGAQAVAADEELERVIPIIERLAAKGVTVSLDTTKPEVMVAGIRAGAKIINDVNALQAPGALSAVAEYPEVSVCLMHMQGQPRTMQNNPRYENVVSEVYDFLSERIAACEKAGISRERVIVDPGIGFGKSPAHNLQLLNQLATFRALQCPLLIGISRKSLIGHLLGIKDPEQRVIGSVAAAVMAFQQGASIFRVHDVEATRQALTVAQAIQAGSLKSGF